MWVKYSVGMLDEGTVSASHESQYAPLMPEGVGVGPGAGTGILGYGTGAGTRGMIGGLETGIEGMEGEGGLE